MAEIPAELLVHEVTVETYEGTSGGTGDIYADAEVLPCFVEDVRKLVLATDGSQVVSESTVIGFLADAGRFTVKSKLTLPSGRRSTVIVARRRDFAGEPDVPEHVEVNCT